MKFLWMLLMLLILFLPLTMGCAGIPLKQPTSDTLMTEAAEVAGYFIGKTACGLEALEYTTNLAGQDILYLEDYEAWQDYMLDLIVDDAFLKARLQTVISLVDVDMADINLAVQRVSDTTKYVRRVLSDFITGLNMGISSKYKSQIDVV